MNQIIIDHAAVLNDSGILPESVQTGSPSPEMANLEAILDGYGAPQQLLADCVGQKLPSLTNDANELVYRTWSCYLFEREKLLRKEPFGLSHTMSRIADRVSGCVFDRTASEIHCLLAKVQWTPTCCGFSIPAVSSGWYRWPIVVALKLTTLCSIWAIAPEKFCHENWSNVLRNFPFYTDSALVAEQIVEEKLRPDPVQGKSPCAESRPCIQLTEMVRSLIHQLENGPRSRRELEESLGVKRTMLRTHYIEPAENLGLVEKTCSQRFAKEQRYRLTACGSEVLARTS